MPSASPAGPASARQHQLPQQPPSNNGYGSQSVSLEAPLWPFVPAQFASSTLPWSPHMPGIPAQNNDANPYSHAGRGQPIGTELVARMFKALEWHRATKKRKERELQTREWEKVQQYESEQRRKRPRLDAGEDARRTTSVDPAGRHVASPQTKESVRFTDRESYQNAPASIRSMASDPANVAHQVPNSYADESPELVRQPHSDTSSRAKSPSNFNPFAAASAALANLRGQALQMQAGPGFTPSASRVASGQQASGSASAAQAHSNEGYGQQLRDEASFRVPETQIEYDYYPASEQPDNSVSAQYSTPARHERIHPLANTRHSLTTPTKNRMAAVTGRSSPRARQPPSSRSPSSVQNLKLGYEATSSRDRISEKTATEEVPSHSRSKGKASSGADGRVNTSSLGERFPGTENIA